MKTQILNYLKSSKDYISGEDLSSKLNVSRNAIWKHMNILKKEGYEIDSIRNKGYKLLSCPNILTTETLHPLLNTSFIGRKLYILPTVDSTNLYGKELCKKEVINGSCIISETQTLGRGRFNRHWESPKGGIWNSVILTPNIDPTEAPKITLIAAVAMHKTLLNMGIETNIKWPNDLYLNNKKICGILTTMNADMDKINYLVLGLGLNVNINKDYFLNNDLTDASSLQIELETSFNLAQILSDFYNQFEKLYNDFTSNLDLFEVVSTLKEYSYFKSTTAYLVTINKKEKVTCLDINSNGELIIKDSQGNIRPVLSGEITFKS